MKERGGCESLGGENGRASSARFVTVREGGRGGKCSSRLEEDLLHAMEASGDGIPGLDGRGRLDVDDDDTARKLTSNGDKGSGGKSEIGLGGVD